MSNSIWEDPPHSSVECSCCRYWRRTMMGLAIKFGELYAEKRKRKQEEKDAKGADARRTSKS